MVTPGYIAQKAAEDRIRQQKEKDKAEEAERQTQKAKEDAEYIAEKKLLERNRLLQKRKAKAAEAERDRVLQEEKDKAAAEARKAKEDAEYIAEKKLVERNRALREAKAKAAAEKAERDRVLQDEKDKAAAGAYDSDTDNSISPADAPSSPDEFRADASYDYEAAWHPQEATPPARANGSYDTDSEDYEAAAIQRQKNESLVDVDLSPYLKVYKNGRVQKLLGSARVNPSETKAENGIFSKDVRISENVQARVYCPANVLGLLSPKKLPILVYYHGGGFCCEAAVTSKTHHYVIQLASKANAVVVSVDYRVAPQHPLPAAFEDALEALRWVASHAPPPEQSSNNTSGLKQKATGIFGATITYAAKIARAVSAQQGARADPVISWLVYHGNFRRLFVGGDGAGGTLAHYVSLQFGKNTSEGNLPLTNGVKILGSILCFPYFLENTTEEASLAYRLWVYLYPKGAHSVYINPFGAFNPFEFQKMLVCYGDETDDRRNMCLNFVKTVRGVDKWKGKVIEYDGKGRGHSFQVKEPTTYHSQKLINQIASFIQT